MKIVMLRSIKPAINLKNNREKLLYRFIRSFYWASRVFVVLFYLLCFKRQQQKRKYFACIIIYLHGIAGLTQWTAFMNAEGAILQS